MAYVELKAPPQPQGLMGEISADFGALTKGLAVTLRHMWQKPVTMQYPEERPQLPPRHRGRHELERHDNGLEKCVGCELCALA